MCHICSHHLCSGAPVWSCYMFAPVDGDLGVQVLDGQMLRADEEFRPQLNPVPPPCKIRACRPSYQ